MNSNSLSKDELQKLQKIFVNLVMDNFLNHGGLLEAREKYEQQNGQNKCSKEIEKLEYLIVKQLFHDEYRGDKTINGNINDCVFKDFIDRYQMIIMQNNKRLIE